MSELAAGFSARNLGYSYAGHPVLCDVTLEGRPGEVVGLLGPNGCGKTTLLKVLSGVLPGYSGSARISGREVRESRPRELSRQVAVVPQESELTFPWTALEVALMGRHPHLAGLAFESERDLDAARSALVRCGAGEFAERTLQELSVGERQRVIFARALAQGTPCLLLDEAASFMDVRHQVELYDLVRDLARGGKSVLAVLHDLNLAAEYCDRIYLMRRGQVEAQGAAREVLTYTNLTRTFETELYVDTNHLTGALVVTPLSGRVREQLAAGKPVQ